jgi:hypothetical protein
MPQDQALPLAGAITLAIAFGWNWATHARAQRDLKGAKAGLARAQRVALSAALSFAGVCGVVLLAAKVWTS